MRVLVDTNILMSALCWPKSTPAAALYRVAQKPILNASIVHEVDVILTGDKDFLSLDLARPRCITAAQFLAEETDA